MNTEAPPHHAAEPRGESGLMREIRVNAKASVFEAPLTSIDRYRTLPLSRGQVSETGGERPS